MGNGRKVLSAIEEKLPPFATTEQIAHIIRNTDFRNEIHLERQGFSKEQKSIVFLKENASRENFRKNSPKKLNDNALRS